MMRFIRIWTVLAALAAAGQAQSVYRDRPDDTKAVYLTADRFAARGDGVADDTAALQAAIDKVQETNGEGIVFIPQGRYRITRTVYVWPSIRLIGYGTQRPVFVLSANTPGFQQGVATMIFFAGMRPTQMRGFRLPPPPPGTVPPNDKIGDANPGTFYSALSNIDFDIGDGNAAAVAVRFHAAQHGYLAHIDFHLGSGLAGIHDAGNIAYDVRFYGGRYGILTKKPSPAWQFTIVDALFDGQREAGIRENEAQLTVVHCTFRNLPTAIAIDTGYSDQLFIKDGRFDAISGPALIISNEKSRMTQINVETTLCRGVAVFARFRESGRQLAGTGALYEVKRMMHGLSIAAPEAVGVIKTEMEPAPLAAWPATDSPALANVPPMNEWTNAKTLGLKGDGATDETAALQKAIDAHKVLYLPMGHYVVSDTLKLRPDSILIGLHPDETQIDVLDGTASFQGPGSARPILLAPSGGTNLVTGIGLYTGGNNSRALGALWMAGATSQMDDVRFLGGHGTRGPNGKREQPYNNNLSADPDARRRWDSQYPSLWVTRGGGGTFSNLWTPSSFAQAGLYVSDTKTPGKVYEVSSEHHVRTEVKVDNVENWAFYALQTEGERGESAEASSLEISRSRNLTFANFHGYRVVRSFHPFPYSIRITESSGIRFRNVHVDNNSSLTMCTEKNGCRQIVRNGKVSYGTAIWDPMLRTEVRDREFAHLDWTGTRPAPPAAWPTTVVAPGAKVERLAGGFYNSSGGAVDAAGQLYFTDTHWQRIYRWSPTKKQLTIVRDSPLDPVNLVFDKAGNLLVTSSGGSGMAVYAFRPDGPEEEVQVLEPQPAEERPGATAVLPPNYWVNGDFTNTLDTATLEYTTLDQMFRKLMTARKQRHYVSPDGSLFLPTDDVVVQGPAYLGYKWAYLLQSYGLVKAEAGRPFYVTNESDQRTYRGRMNADGSLADLATFVEQGGESLTQDHAGNVYLAAGQIFVYTPTAKLIDVIRVPERPLQILFGGADRRTLFILTQSSLYSVRVR